ncbi:MAG: hypothetical protein ACYC63_20510 [Armatimonadota bacterium]
MDIVQVTRRIVDQQVRPAQRGSTTREVRAATGSCGALVTMDAAGGIHSFGTYGRGKYGQQRYLAARRRGV